MAEEPTRITPGMAIIFSLLLVGTTGTGVYLFTQENIDKGYICSADVRYQMGDYLSGDLTILNWVDELGVSQQSPCDGGIWIPIQTYAADHNISIDELLNNPQEGVVVETPRVVSPISYNFENIFYTSPDGRQVWVPLSVFNDCVAESTVKECIRTLLISQIGPVVEPPKAVVIDEPVKAELAVLTYDDLLVVN